MLAPPFALNKLLPLNNVPRCGKSITTHVTEHLNTEASPLPHIFSLPQYAFVYVFFGTMTYKKGRDIMSLHQSDGAVVHVGGDVSEQTVAQCSSL